MTRGNSSASETLGTIDADAKFAWSENLGWINFAAPLGNVVVTDAGLTGAVWNEAYGWIILNPALAGVSNDGAGNLSGNAWGENVGYIDFTGVTIDSAGFFHGGAYGDLSEYVQFNCADNDTCPTSDFKVRTDWRPLSVRTAASENPDGGLSRAVLHQILPDSEEEHRAAPEIPALEYRLLNAEHWSSAYFAVLRSLVKSPECQQGEIVPDAPISRAEVVKMSLCAFGYEIQPDALPSFPDFDPHHWAAAYIATAEAHKIINGYGDGTFQPDRTVNRAEALKIFCLAAKLSPDYVAPTTPFPDVEASAWYVPVVNYAAKQQIVNGYGDGTFHPEQPVTWAEAAKIAVKTGEVGSLISR